MNLPLVFLIKVYDLMTITRNWWSHLEARGWNCWVNYFELKANFSITKFQGLDWTQYYYNFPNSNWTILRRLIFKISQNYQLLENLWGLLSLFQCSRLSKKSWIWRFFRFLFEIMRDYRVACRKFMIASPTFCQRHWPSAKTRWEEHKADIDRCRAPGAYGKDNGIKA